MNWLQPSGIYVVDVHGSIVHRQAIEEGLRISGCDNYRFRWLHEPLIQFAGERGDQHAGGVETALVELISPSLVDRTIFPENINGIKAGQMNMDEAIELAEDLPAFVKRVEESLESRTPLNGIVGDIENYEYLDAQEMMQRMWNVASDDLRNLLQSLE